MTPFYCFLCHNPIAENEAYVVLPPLPAETAKHKFHLYCWLRRYRDEGGGE